MAKKLSCVWIESGLSVMANRISICCSYNDAVKIHPFPLPTSSSRLISTIIEKRNELKKRNESGQPAGCCARCPHLRNEEWPEQEYVVSKINFSALQLCQCKCTYCYSTDVKRLNDLPTGLTAMVENLIISNSLSPKANINWGGGEPTLLPEFAKMIALLESHGCWQMINSNCIKYVHEVGRIIDRGKAVLVTSLDSGSKESYRKIKGVDAFEQVLINIRKYNEHNHNGRSIKVKYIIAGQGDLENDLKAYADIVRELRVIGVIDIEKNERNPKILTEKSKLIDKYVRLIRKDGLDAEVGQAAQLYFPTVGLVAKW